MSESATLDTMTVNTPAGNDDRYGLPPAPDRPGANTTVHPARAPAWIAPLIDHNRVDQRRLEDIIGITNPPKGTIRTHSAVLMLFTGQRSGDTPPDDAGIVITHRSPTMRTHAGQMAFPGGRIDPTDVNAVDCALREAWEETGLDRTTVTPLAQIGERHVRSSLHPVHPVIAYWEKPTTLHPTSLEETDDVYVAPLAELADPANRVMVEWKQYRGPAFRSNGYLIWGFTGGLISAALSAAGWDTPWDKDTPRDLLAELDASRNQESHG